jgi:hypothetical protein
LAQVQIGVEILFSNLPATSRLAVERSLILVIAFGRSCILAFGSRSQILRSLRSARDIGILVSTPVDANKKGALKATFPLRLRASPAPPARKVGNAGEEPRETTARCQNIVVKHAGLKRGAPASQEYLVFGVDIDAGGVLLPARGRDRA